MKEFQEILLRQEGDLKCINEIIEQFAVGKSSLIKEISNHLISSGGKRLRPILLILSAEMCGTKRSNQPAKICNHHNLAAAVELIHTATLLHDDVVDASQVRRGKKTASAIWDNKASILVGDYLFSLSFQLMVKSENLNVLALLAKTSSVIADGEVMQLQNSNNVDLSEEKYLEIIFGKTAALFSAACEVGALINDRSQDEIIALRNFGKNLGMIFQIIDDVLDYSSKTEILGKEIGNDFFEGKMTLPIIIAYKLASSAEQRFVAEIFSQNSSKTSEEKFVADDKIDGKINQKRSKQDLENFSKILALIEKYDAVKLSKDLAFKFYLEAENNLKIFNDCSAKQDLKAILSYSLHRIS